MIKITANGVCARAQRLEPLTSGMVGAKVAFALSPDFDGLTVTAVFTNGAVTKDVLNPGNECFIPPEVLETAGKIVQVGIYAVRGSELVIPTVYAPIGVVLPGADPSGDTSTSATLPAWAQIEAMIGSLDDLTTESKNNLVAAINEAAQTGGGGTSDHSQLTNRDTANQHPITAITGLQTALDGKADAADIPSLEGYATEAYVQSYHDNTKQDIINDLATIRSGAALGATAVQPETGKGLFSGSYNDLTDKPEIPDAVTEGTVSGWGFTKNTGTYSKPTDGIPKSDLAAAVQTSLGKADTALQKHQSLAAYRTAAAQDVIDSGKQDRLIAGDNITIAADGKTISATGGAGALTVHVTDNNGTLSADKSYSDIWDAIHAGISVFVDYDGTAFPPMGLSGDLLTFGITDSTGGDSVGTTMILITSADEVAVLKTIIYELPNPNAITFTGAVTGSYDGSAPLSVNIPTVPTKTSQLENDSGYLTLATLPKYGGESV